jgi:uncharacterized membrane protein YeiB
VKQRDGPVHPTDRILFIGVLRDLALFGMLAANLRGLRRSSTAGKAECPSIAVRTFSSRSTWFLSTDGPLCR